MMNLSMTPRDDLDPLAPQREAAMFYGLFLRGHSAETLRRDIDVPKPVLDKWLNRQRYETGFRDALGACISTASRCWPSSTSWF